jgi:hypothetical protein
MFTLILLLALTQSTRPRPDAGFEAAFTGRTLRFDYHHTGTAGEEHIAPARTRLEGEWPGSRTQLVDDTNLGLYLFEVRRPEPDELLYSRGFASIYGEWETTAEARGGWRAFHESQRFPEPKFPVRLVLRKRGADGSFQELWKGEVDPQSRFVDRSPLLSSGEVFKLLVSGPPATKVDLLIVSEGYPRLKREKFLNDARRLVDVLLATPPFSRRIPDFNVNMLYVPSPDNGIPNPRQASWPRTNFGLAYNAFDSDRYVLASGNEALREAVAWTPYDALILLFNERKYGGGGIYNLWATVAADTEPAPYVFVHEFGHSFAGLGDEYYTSQVAYEDFVKPGVEPWEPNVTALLDPARLKWKELVRAGTPLPTPWGQARYDEIDLAYQKKRAQMTADHATEAAMEELFREVKGTTGPLLAAEKFANRVGAFEGASYEAKGLYRPEIDCIMFTRNPTHFCRVCERAIEQAIERAVD